MTSLLEGLSMEGIAFGYLTDYHINELSEHFIDVKSVHYIECFHIKRNHTLLYRTYKNINKTFNISPLKNVSAACDDMFKK